jgi:hypothetical protein
MHAIQSLKVDCVEITFIIGGVCNNPAAGLRGRGKRQIPQALA